MPSVLVPIVDINSSCRALPNDCLCVERVASHCHVCAARGASNKMDRRCLAPVEVAARNAKLHADNGIVPTNAVATAKANARRRRRIESCNICMYFGLLLEGAGNEWSLGEFPQSGTGKQGPALRRDDAMTAISNTRKNTITPAAPDPLPATTYYIVVVLLTAVTWAFTFLPPKRSGRNNRVCH